MRKKKFIDHRFPIAFAHRGGALDAPENSLTAFKLASSMGYKYLETDVHATKDGVVIAFHDHVLERVTDSVGVIADLEYAEIASAKINGEERIPLLIELLEEFPEARFNIDPKHDGVVDPLIKIIQSTKAIDRICIGSFSDTRIGRIAKILGENLCTGMGPRGISKIQLGRFVNRLEIPSGDCVQVPMHVKGVPLITPKFVERVHSLGKVIHAWTINERNDIEKLLDYGVDGIMTDRLDVLKSTFTDRGIWF